MTLVTCYYHHVIDSGFLVIDNTLTAPNTVIALSSFLAAVQMSRVKTDPYP